MRPTEAVIDLGAIARNIKRLAALAAPAQLCAVTKADGYGHGSVEAAQTALDAGASWIAVALVEEGIELRQAGITAPILLLSEPRPVEMVEVVEASLVPTLYTPEGLVAVSQVAVSQAAVGTGGTTAPISVHVNIDTGMHRVGLRPADAVGFVQKIFDDPRLKLGGVWTHFAVADEPGNPETQRQLARFDDVRRHLDTEFGDAMADVMVHASNSAGLLAVTEARFDMVRMGIATYGLEPAAGVGSDAGLEPAMSLHTELSLVKAVAAGESISYGLRHTFETDTIVGTIPMGYADGLRRDSFARGVPILVGGERRKIVGVVTMDQTMLDLGPDSTATAGDEAVIIGTQGDASIQVPEIAELLGTISYEVVCDIGRRVRRRYVR